MKKKATGAPEALEADSLDDFVGRLVVLAARLTGVSEGSIHPENVRRAARPLLSRGVTAAEILRRAEAGEAEVVAVLRRSVSIGETYFFRYPNQFQFLRSSIVPALLSVDAATLRVWSAGCATGEEAYSLAALFRELGVPAQRQIDVLGTDHLDEHVAIAQRGVYRPWSVRDSAPILSPLFDWTADDDGPVRIRDDVRSLTRFQVHNLLTPPPGSFELIFCRNVLIYYEGEAIGTILGLLASALAPGGVLVLGVVDPPGLPPGLRSIGPPELRAYRRDSVATHKPSTPSAPRPPRALRAAPIALGPQVQAALPRSGRDPLRLHLQALGLIEQDRHHEAEALLDEILAEAPDYIAARLERALLHQRFGETAAMYACAHDVLDRLRPIADESVVPGPELLPASYYRASTEALLRTAPRRRG